MSDCAAAGSGRSLNVRGLGRARTGRSGAAERSSAHRQLQHEYCEDEAGDARQQRDAHDGQHEDRRVNHQPVERREDEAREELSDVDEGDRVPRANAAGRRQERVEDDATRDGRAAATDGGRDHRHQRRIPRGRQLVHVAPVGDKRHGAQQQQQHEPQPQPDASSHAEVGDALGGSRSAEQQQLVPPARCRAGLALVGFREQQRRLLGGAGCGRLLFSGGGC